MTTSIASRQAIAADLLARWAGGKGPHAVLLTGAEGVGKHALGRALAAALLNVPETAAEDWTHPDFVDLRPDSEAATPTIGVEAVRAACAQLRLTPARGGRRVALVDAGDDLTLQAANALLKTLEEPPAGAVLLVVAHAPGKLPATVRSRCTIVRVPAPTTAEALDIVQRQKPDLAAAAAKALLSLAGGSPGRAIELAKADALEAYAALVDALQGLAGKGLDRSAAHRFVAAHGGERFDAAAALIDAFLHRAAVGAAGSPETEATPGEAALHQALVRQAGLSGLTRAQELAAKVADDTQTQHLDARYATMRLLLAVEHGVKSATTAKAA